MANPQNKLEQRSSNQPIKGKDQRTEEEKNKQQANQKQNKKKDASNKPGDRC